MSKQTIEINGMVSLEVKLLWGALGLLSVSIIIIAIMKDPTKIHTEVPFVLACILGFGAVLTLLLHSTSFLLTKKLYFDGKFIRVGHPSSEQVFQLGDIQNINRTMWRKPYVNEIRLKSGEKIRFGVPMWLVDAVDKHAFASKVKAKYLSEFAKVSH